MKTNISHLRISMQFTNANELSLTTILWDKKYEHRELTCPAQGHSWLKATRPGSDPFFPVSYPPVHLKEPNALLVAFLQLCTTYEWSAVVLSGAIWKYVREGRRQRGGNVVCRCGRVRVKLISYWFQGCRGFFICWWSPPLNNFY